MNKLDKIVNYLDKTLKNNDIPDYPGAINGLQLRGNSKILKVGAAVDAALPVINDAIQSKVNLLIVHHGMFWGGTQKIDGALYEKIKLSMDAGMAIYSSHIPLDIHPKYGNNVLLAKALGLSKGTPFLDWEGIKIGLKYNLKIKRKTLIRKIEKAVNGKVHLAPGGHEEIRKIGLVTGGAGSMIESVANQGIDTFITGEGAHHTYTLAEELGVNLIYAGHYSTETFGVKALARHVAEKYNLKNIFIDHPTGL